MAEFYLLTCMRYIQNNPVHAAMVEGPAHYGWTRTEPTPSDKTSPLLAPHAAYLALGAADNAPP